MQFWGMTYQMNHMAYSNNTHEWFLSHHKMDWNRFLKKKTLLYYKIEILKILGFAWHDMF